MDVSVLLDRLCYRHPSVLVDAIDEHEPGKRLVAHKNVTINEDFFQGHFPGVPLMPGVLMLETLTQVAAALVLDREGPMPMSRVYLHGVDGAKFRRQVVPGDQLRLEVTLLKARTTMAKTRGVAFVGDQIVAEMDLLLAVVPDGVRIHPTAVVMKGARYRGRDDHRSERRGRRARSAWPPMPHWRVGGGGRVHGHRRRDRDLSFRVDRPHPAGPQIQR